MHGNWDRRYLELAKFVATSWSKDPSTKVGAVVVNYEQHMEFIGYNGFPRGVGDTPERLNTREVKYQLVCHAEVNAIIKAGPFARGASLYVWPSFALPPICNECVKVAIQSGIKEIIGYIPTPEAAERSKRWADSIAIARGMAREAGVIWYAMPEDPNDSRVRFGTSE